MKTLVTGSTGNVGAYVVKELQKLSEDIVAAGTNESKMLNMFGNKARAVEFDFTKPNTFG